MMIQAREPTRPSERLSFKERLFSSSRRKEQSARKQPTATNAYSCARSSILHNKSLSRTSRADENLALQKFGDTK